jgi:hypothetical protein
MKYHYRKGIKWGSCLKVAGFLIFYIGLMMLVAAATIAVVVMSAIWGAR